jgi:hypothetical protein
LARGETLDLFFSRVKNRQQSYNDFKSAARSAIYTGVQEHVFLPSPSLKPPEIHSDGLGQVFLFPQRASKGTKNGRETTDHDPLMIS